MERERRRPPLVSRSGSEKDPADVGQHTAAPERGDACTHDALTALSLNRRRGFNK